MPGKKLAPLRYETMEVIAAADHDLIRDELLADLMAERADHEATLKSAQETHRVSEAAFDAVVAERDEAREDHEATTRRLRERRDMTNALLKERDAARAERDAALAAGQRLGEAVLMDWSTGRTPVIHHATQAALTAWAAVSGSSEPRTDGTDATVWYRAVCSVCGDSPDQDGGEFRTTPGEALSAARDDEWATEPAVLCLNCRPASALDKGA